MHHLSDRTTRRAASKRLQRLLSRYLFRVRWVEGALAVPQRDRAKRSPEAADPRRGEGHAYWCCFVMSLKTVVGHSLRNSQNRRVIVMASRGIAATPWRVCGFEI